MNDATTTLKTTDIDTEDDLLVFLDDASCEFVGGGDLSNNL